MVRDDGLGPAALARSAHTFLHPPMVAGIVASAVGDELVISHPGEARVEVALTASSGPVLFLAGHALFKRVLWGHLPASHLAGVAALIALMPAEFVALAVAAAAVTVVVAVASWESLRRGPRASLGITRQARFFPPFSGLDQILTLDLP
ncbi:low temperature requirement protein A [Planotetraspora kaengkrachanensis]|uniref:Uncharacterized protein n=1 Tax=Planotetraspora kaengkrachanensis TaxID=575193 RepID=A0A8J3LXV5_9ACTN|nr:low temperature requirement protein A [Planotetraspora kaengkrachanensis]GIG80727.1 hypothetical protein Pka01_38540 [Planotetraspora kaengkrachanensis]